MSLVSITMLVNGNPVTMVYDPMTDSYSGTLPAVGTDEYDVTIDTHDSLGQEKIDLAVLSVPENQLVKLTIKDGSNVAIEDVIVTAYYRNLTTGENNGIADVRTTDENGVVWFYLELGKYNFKIEHTGYKTKTVSNVELTNGISEFQDTAGTITKESVLLDNQGNPIKDAWVKVYKKDETDPITYMTNADKTDTDGAWSFKFSPDIDYTVVFSKIGYSYIKTDYKIVSPS